MARSSVRQMWKDKLEGRLAPKVWPSAPVLTRPPYAGRVLGIDPSLRGTGLALIEFVPGRTPLLLRCQTVRVGARATMATCLGEIHRAVADFVAEFDPAHVGLVCALGRAASRSGAEDRAAAADLRRARAARFRASR